MNISYSASMYLAVRIISLHAFTYPSFPKFKSVAQQTAMEPPGLEPLTVGEP